MHLADAMNLLGVEEDSLSCRRLPCVDVRDDADVARSLEGIFSRGHGSSTAVALVP
jgi:hypothetical protein